MEFVEVIGKRRTIRDFSQEKVKPEIVEKALEAGLKAPSYNHLKEWDFILVDDAQTRFALTQTEKMILSAPIPFGYKATDGKIYPQTEVKLSERLHINVW